jgi:hypothetical protein
MHWYVVRGEVRLRLKCDDTRAETRFRLSPKRTSPFKPAGASFQSTTGSRGMSISGSNAGYTMFRGSVKSTGYPLHLPVSPSLPLPCVIVCHHISTGLYRPPTMLSQAWPETTAETLDRCTEFKIKNGIWSSHFLLHANISATFLHFSFFSFLTLFPWKLFVSGIQGHYALEKPTIVINPKTWGNSERGRI